MLIPLLLSCVGSKYLKEDEKLLYKQKIKSEAKVNKEPIKLLFKQTANGKLPLTSIMPYVWIYKKGEKKYDTAKILRQIKDITIKYDNKIDKAGKKKLKRYKIEKKKNKKIEKKNRDLKEGNLMMRWGKPLVIYDSALIEETRKNINLYFEYKGFLNTQTKVKVETKKRNASVTYFINKGTPHVIDSIIYEDNDTIISKILHQNQEESLIKKGHLFDRNNLEKERERIDLLLKDNGYYDFSKHYINFNIDTTLGNNSVYIARIIKKPAKRGYHKQFKIDSVVFVTDANVSGSPGEKRKSIFLKGINYSFFQDIYSEKTLDQRLFIYPDSLYSKTNTFSTQKQLANLDNFKFININYDTTGGKFIANIFASPQKRKDFSNELGFLVSQGPPSPFYKINFKNRNLFQGFEVLEINGRAGIEGIPSPTDENAIYRSQEVLINTSLTFPQFAFPFGKKIKARLGDINPKTKLNLGYSFLNRPDYKRTNTQSSLTYSWLSKKKAQHNFTLSDFNIINSKDLSQTFLERLQELENAGNNLIKSFEPSFVSSMQLSSLYNFNRYGLSSSNASYLKLYLESGGTFLQFTEPKFLTDQNLELYQFYKINADFRKTSSISLNGILAYRINVGIANPYGENNVLPYEKYFFAGGSSSIRAWRPRRLGPGSFSASDDRFEQQGEVIIESSVEVRRNLIGFIDGALFIDMGNIWTLREEEARPGSKFEVSNFMNEIAVGAGFGIRFDFSFLILRFDTGIKILDPAQPLGKRYVGDEISLRKPLGNKGQAVFNLGVGYPF